MFWKIAVQVEYFLASMSIVVDLQNKKCIKCTWKDFKRVFMFGYSICGRTLPQNRRDSMWNLCLPSLTELVIRTQITGTIIRYHCCIIECEHELTLSFWPIADFDSWQAHRGLDKNPSIPFAGAVPLSSGRVGSSVPEFSPRQQQVFTDKMHAHPLHHSHTEMIR